MKHPDARREETYEKSKAAAVASNGWRAPQVYLLVVVHYDGTKARFDAGKSLDEAYEKRKAVFDADRNNRISHAWIIERIAPP